MQYLSDEVLQVGHYRYAFQQSISGLCSGLYVLDIYAGEASHRAYPGYVLELIGRGSIDSKNLFVSYSAYSLQEVCVWVCLQVMSSRGCGECIIIGV